MKKHVLLLFSVIFISGTSSKISSENASPEFHHFSEVPPDKNHWKKAVEHVFSQNKLFAVSLKFMTRLLSKYEVQQRRFTTLEKSHNFLKNFPNWSDFHQDSQCVSQDFKIFPKNRSRFSKILILFPTLTKCIFKNIWS